MKVSSEVYNYKFMLLSWFLATWIGRRIRIWLLSAKCWIVEISEWGWEFWVWSLVSWLAKAQLGCQLLPPSLWLPRITMKNNVFLLWKNPHKPADWDFLSYCILQYLPSFLTTFTFSGRKDEALTSDCRDTF